MEGGAAEELPDAGAARVVLVRLVHGGHVVAAPGLGLLQMVPDKLARALALAVPALHVLKAPVLPWADMVVYILASF